MFNPKGFDRQWLALIGGDITVAVASAYGGNTAVAWWGAGAPATLPEVAAALAVVSVFASYLSDLYQPDLLRSRSRILRSIAREQLIAAMLASVLFARPEILFGRRFFVSYILISIPVMLAWRLAAGELFAGRIRISVAILGTGEDAAMLAGEVIRRAHLGYTFAGFVVLEVGRERPGASVAPPRGIVSPIREHKLLRVQSLAQLQNLQTLAILAVAESASAPLLCRDLIKLRVRGTEVVSLEKLYEQLTGRLPTAMLSESWFALAQGFHQSRFRAALKRVIDVAVATSIAIITAPVAAAAAIAIKLGSAGPVFYRQERIGCDGRVFEVLKFRSMYQDAENGTGAVWAQEHDERITRVGRWLRKWRIDELPQLINILRGEMTMIGPRPERPEIVARLAEQIPFYQYRHLVRPGLTGWAQVCYPYGATVAEAHEKLCYDLYYMKNWSLGFDLQILIQTVKVVLFGRGAR